MPDNAFHYNVIPSGSGVSTRVALQEDLDSDTLLAQVAAQTGQTQAVVDTVGRALFAGILDAARASRTARRVCGLFTFKPSCGGKHADADFQPTVENMNLDVNLTLSPEGHAVFETGITFVRDAVLGDKVPAITRVYDATTRTLDRCTPGGAFRISGHDFGPEPGPADTTLGLFLAPVSGGGAALHVASYSHWTATEIMGAWPPGLTGAQRLSLVVRYTGGGASRTGIYSTNLNP